MFKVGLTGGIGTGKSSVAKWLADRGIKVFDADQAVHQLYLQPHVTQGIIKEFGPEYADDQGKINRTLLGKLIFSDEQAKKRLNRFFHPLVETELLKACLEREQTGEKVLVFDIPLLYEAGWDSYMDEVWVVYVPHEIQVERIIKRNGLMHEEAEQRIAAQMPLEEKIKKADRMIDNSGSFEETERQLDKIWEVLQIKLQENVN